MPKPRHTLFIFCIQLNKKDAWIAPLACKKPLPCILWRTFLKANYMRIPALSSGTRQKRGVFRYRYRNFSAYDANEIRLVRQTLCVHLPA